MIRNNLKSFLKAAVLLPALLFTVSSCISDAVFEQPEMRTVPALSFDLEELDPESIDTRSSLTDNNIEGKKTSVTLAAYTNGTLYAKQNYTSSLTSMSLSLEKGYTYNVYALVNMGDMTSQVPNAENALSSVTYAIPSYTSGNTSVNSRGIPMAGVLENLSVTSSTSGTKTVPVKRLLAKVEATFSCDWDGAVITGAKVYNMNAQLKPFGTSAAASASDILSFQEIHGSSQGSSSTLNATFYVPENMQGTISGINSSENKSPDKNNTVNSRRARLTYMEATVRSTNGPVAGNITYRSYLGSNATNNFDIERNTRYLWTVNYHSDRTQDPDWKREGDMFRIQVTADRTEAYVGETVNLTATLIPTSGSSSNVTTSNGTTWSRQVGDNVVSVNNSGNSKGRVTATAAGSATFRAVYTSSGLSAWANSPQITFLAPTTVYRYVMELANGATPANATINVGGTQGYRVRRYSDIYHGSTVYQQDQTGEVLPATTGYWITGSSSIATVSQGTVTGVGAGTTTVGWRLAASGNADCSGSVTVNNVVSNWLEITPENPTETAGTAINLVAKYHTVTNGVDDGGVVVTTNNNTTWSRASGSSQITVGNGGWNGNPKGQVTCPNTIQTAQTATVQATYNGQTASTTVTFNPTVDYVLVVNPSTLSLNVGASSSALTASVYQVVGGQRQSTPVASNVNASWSSSNSGVASVSNGGVVTGVSAGSASITATYTYNGTQLTSSGNDACAVTVSNVVSNWLEVTPSTVTGTAGTPVSLVAKYHTVTNGQDNGGTVVTTSANWTRQNGSSQISVNNTNNKGQVTCPNSITTAQTATVRASYNGQTADASVTFNPDFSYELVIIPSTLSVNVGATNTTLRAHVYRLVGGVRENNPIQSNVNASWTSSATSIATVNGSGAVTGVAAGTAYISASYIYNGAQLTTKTNDRCTVTVSNVVSNFLEITPNPAEGTAGTTISLVAKYHTVTNGQDDGGTVVTTSATWSHQSGSSSITVSNSGNAKGQCSCPNTIQSAQTATVQATYNGQTATTSVTFNPTIGYVLAISPSSLSVNVGANSSALTANVYRVVGGQRESSPVASNVNATWSSSATGTATVNGSGVVHGVRAGTAYISASYNYNGTSLTTSGSDRCAVTVSNVVTYRLRVDPSTASIYVGGTRQLMAAIDVYVNGTVSGPVVDVTSSATWSSSATGRATVSSSGLVTGVATGSAYISASCTYNGVQLTTSGNDRCAVTVIADQIVSYGVPAATLTYNPNPLPYTGGTSNPTLRVSQVAHYGSGRTETLTYTTLPSGSTVVYRSRFPEITPATGEVNATTGVVTMYPNVGPTTTTYGTPEVTLSYNPTTFAVQGGTANPTLTYRQKKTVTRGATSATSFTVAVQVTVNGVSGGGEGIVDINPGGDTNEEWITTGGSVSYSGSATGFSLNTTSGVVTASSNEGTTSTSYANPTVSLSYTGTPIAYTGGTANATLSYSQTVTTTRTSTNARSIAVTASVSMNGKTGSSSPVTLNQSADQGSSTQSTVTSGGSVSYSGSATGFTVNSSSGAVTAASNAGSTSTTYGTPAVTLTYPTAPISYQGGTASPSLSYSQTETITRAQTSQRSVNVTASVTVNGKTGTASQSVVQSADQGSTTNNTLTTGATVTYSKQSGGSEFSVDSSTGVVSATDNLGIEIHTYGTPQVSLSYSPNPVGNAGGMTTPTVTYSQVHRVRRPTTSSRTASIRASVSMHGQTGSSTVNVSQQGDPGAAETSTNETTGGTVSYSMAAQTGFTLNSTTTGVITVAQNNGAARSTTVTASVTRQGLTGTDQETVTQSATSVQYRLVVTPASHPLLAVGATMNFKATLQKSTDGGSTWSNSNGDMNFSTIVWELSTDSSSNPTNWSSQVAYASIASTGSPNYEGATTGIAVGSNIKVRARGNTTAATGSVSVVATYVLFDVVPANTPGWDDTWDDQGGIII